MYKIQPEKICWNKKKMIKKKQKRKPKNTDKLWKMQFFKKNSEQTNELQAPPTFLQTYS